MLFLDMLVKSLQQSAFQGKKFSAFQADHSAVREVLLVQAGIAVEPPLSVAGGDPDNVSVLSQLVEIAIDGDKRDPDAAGAQIRSDLFGRQESVRMSF